MATSIELHESRPCCRLLRDLSNFPGTLKNPEEASHALAVLSEHCALMKLMGQSAVKWDLSKSECYLAVSPDDAETVIHEIGKTAAVQSSLEKYAAILNHINGILANNAKLKQFSDRINFVLGEIREGEKKFGRVPNTSLLKENTSVNALSAGDALKAHPLLENKTQFDGAPKKANLNPEQDPNAAENAEALRNQPSPAPSPAPKFIRG